MPGRERRGPSASREKLGKISVNFGPFSPLAIGAACHLSPNPQKAAIPVFLEWLPGAEVGCKDFILKYQGSEF